MKACRNPVAPPSRRTMRPPTASLPRLRPLSATSIVIGSTTKLITIDAMKAIESVA